MAAVTETTRLSFVGRLAQPGFAAFVRQRAARLELELAVHGAGSGRFTVDVSGQPDLIDAFEMACSLGPLDSLVLDCERTATHRTSGGDQER
ncbi:hypothetical protein [Kumtagia ephedrae]|uniref:hypothetical protein n=1 Tax=Kumtagia ephedrae TaxID=2116701 RepID=UPI001FE03491|nr:hypothetical protein [Mesorhizobium ephedrae]